MVHEESNLIKGERDWRLSCEQTIWKISGFFLRCTFEIIFLYYIIFSIWFNLMYSHVDLSPFGRIGGLTVLYLSKQFIVQRFHSTQATCPIKQTLVRKVESSKPNINLRMIELSAIFINWLAKKMTLSIKFKEHGWASRRGITYSILHELLHYVVHFSITLDSFRNRERVYFGYSSSFSFNDRQFRYSDSLTVFIFPFFSQQAQPKTKHVQCLVAMRFHWSVYFNLSR